MRTALLSGSSVPKPRCIVAIPACDEAMLLPGCLAALAVQRDRVGCPVARDTFSVLVLANNCTDDTERVARDLAKHLPFDLLVDSVRLPPERSSAGWARKLAMDEAARRLAPHGPRGAVLTTDADTQADSRWVATILAELDTGIDAVAGYVDPDPHDYLALGPAFMARGRSEDTYLRLVAEIWALLDPRPHDPWPNHRVASGANLGIGLTAFEGVGGVPPIASGEDAALVRALDAAGYRVRHALDARVTTSCRTQGRAVGGAADAIRLRHRDTDADCDLDMEPAQTLARRAYWKGWLRRWYESAGAPSAEAWVDKLRIARGFGTLTAADVRAMPFAHLWDEVEASSPLLGFGKPLRPSDLPRQIAVAERLLARLRRFHPERKEDRPDTHSPSIAAVVEHAVGQLQ